MLIYSDWTTFFEHLILYTLALRMVLKTTYKAPGITDTSMFKLFHICMCIGINTIYLVLVYTYVKNEKAWFPFLSRWR